MDEGSSPEPLLAASAEAGVLELRPGGSWTASNAAVLERLFEEVAPKLQGVRGVRIDLAGVQEIDTLGAWLLEKMSRRAAQTGHHRRTGRRRRALCRTDRRGS